jgi:heavy metal efflux system protein
VDGAIVMVDQFVRQFEERTRCEDGRDVAGSETGDAAPGGRRVARPVLFGVSIIVAVYIPIFTLGGMEGRMFRPMAFTVVVAVLGSLLLALTYVPAVAARWLHPEARKPFPAARPRDGAYGRVLETMLAQSGRSSWAGRAAGGRLAGGAAQHGQRVHAAAR